ncbi:MAG: response regulator [Longimicrobiales bacterium]
MVIDDDRALLEGVKSILSAEGYDVFPAPSGRAALRLLPSLPSLDVVITDVRLPYMQLHELVVRLRDLTSASIIVMSGAPREQLGPLPTQVVAFLTKPLLPATLLATVARALGPSTEPTP